MIINTLPNYKIILYIIFFMAVILKILPNDQRIYYMEVIMNSIMQTFKFILLDYWSIDKVIADAELSLESNNTINSWQHNINTSTSINGYYRDN